MSGKSSASRGEARFDTALGVCGIGWTESGVACVRLPGDPGIDLMSPMPVNTPAWLSAAVDGIRRLLSGEPADLTGIPVDLATVPPFLRRVLVEARSIPAGVTETYGNLAAKVGRPGAARAVGQAMARNPVPLVVPCHRVVGASGAMCGFSAAGGVVTKRRLLDLEARASKA
jgi:methylated-DNA-[protein]-cysteine S-methyltransferase